MEILLMCPGASTGQAAFVAELIEGIRAPERRYDIKDGKIVLSGFDEVILHHDADELLVNPMYRMPTPAEQEQMAQAQMKISTAEEDAAAKDVAETSDVPPALDNTSADADSTVQSKKKASGG